MKGDATSVSETSTAFLITRLLREYVLSKGSVTVVLNVMSSLSLYVVSLSVNSHAFKVISKLAVGT